MVDAQHFGENSENLIQRRFQSIANEHVRAQAAYGAEIAQERVGITESDLSCWSKLGCWFEAVRWYSHLMRAKLRRVKHKRDWRNRPLAYRVHRMRQEMIEALTAFEDYHNYTLQPNHDAREAERLAMTCIDEFTDVGITAMIAADFFRG